ncbi:hypothetical protein [Mycobacterium kiyosense]|uniref:Uncharacterized protein n=1 Tax=Mycobacterium kiyosense TaxID=2871094 RepID=A0AA37V5Y7_9MYCO|nr:hypothetical protein [Mycobacterium kiyosense]GLB83824.1 hypothetical protein SRL2020028_30800 [Mycobacterium kiyosense]
MGAWLRPIPQYHPPTPPTYTSQQIADAKAKVCAAYGSVHSAIEASASRDVGTDPTSKLAFAINGRQALLAGSQYLRTVLGSEPATPSGLAAKISKITDIYQELTIDYLNGKTEVQMQSITQVGNKTASNIESLCK